MVVTSENLLSASSKNLSFNIEHSIKQKYPQKHEHYNRLVA